MSGERATPLSAEAKVSIDGDGGVGLEAHRWIEDRAGASDIQRGSGVLDESKWNNSSGLSMDPLLEKGTSGYPGKETGNTQAILLESVGIPQLDVLRDAETSGVDNSGIRPSNYAPSTLEGHKSDADEGEEEAKNEPDEPKELAPSEKKTSEKKMVTIRIRPQDGEWVMADDYEVTVPFDLSIMNLKKVIEEERGIHHERSNIMHPRVKKYIEKNRESWSLRRHGIGNREIVVMSPTSPGGWIWHPIEWYRQKVINEIISEILLAGNYMRLVDIERKVQKPPPIRESLSVLIKQYPEQIHARTELSTGHTLLGISMIGQTSAFYESKLAPVPKEIMQLPTYEAGSVLAGTKNPPIDTYDFDWDAYSDLDSVGFDVGVIVMPDTIYNIAIFGAFACWPDMDPFNTPNPFVDVYWNGKRTGRTPLQCFTFTPSWINCKIQLRQGPKEDINDCHLRINLFSFRESSTCVLLGTIDFDGPQLKELLAPQIDARIERFQLKTFQPSAKSIKQMKGVSKKLVTSASSVAADDGTGVAQREDKMVKDEEDVAYNADIAAELEAKVALDFPHDALLEEDGHFDAGRATIKLVVLHCEFEVRVHFCSKLVNQESADVSPFVIVIFNGRDIGMTDVKSGDSWPVWEEPPSYSMKVGTLDLFECSLNIEVWQMGSTGRENILGQVVFAGKQFVDLVGEASKHFVRHVRELSMPIVKSKDNKSAPAAKNAKKAKVITDLGKVCFDVGPVGLPPPRDREFEISIVAGIMLPGENVYCEVYWNHVSIGSTNPAVYVDPLANQPEGTPLAEVEIHDSNANPPWTWPINKFSFSCSDEEDALKNSSLKIFLIDFGERKRKLKPGEKPPVIKLGCISLTGDTLVDFLTTENSLAAIERISFAKDPDDPRPQRPPKGQLVVRRGPKGSRLNEERTLVVHAAKLKLKDLKLGSCVAPRRMSLKTSLIVEENTADEFNTQYEFGYFFNAYFNDEHVGVGPHCIVDEGVNPFWNDAWFQLPVNGRPLKECTARLELMMYRAIPAPDENDQSAIEEGSHSAAVGSSSRHVGSSSKRGNNEMLKAGEGLPFPVGNLILSGNALKAVVGSKLVTRSEKVLESVSTQKSMKSKKIDNFNLTPDPLTTHSLASGVVLIGSPGTAVSSPLDILKADSKALVEKYQDYTSALDVDIAISDIDKAENAKSDSDEKYPGEDVNEAKLVVIDGNTASFHVDGTEENGGNDAEAKVGAERKGEIAGKQEFDDVDPVMRNENREAVENKDVRDSKIGSKAEDAGSKDDKMDDHDLDDETI